MKASLIEYPYLFIIQIVNFVDFLVSGWHFGNIGDCGIWNGCVVGYFDMLCAGINL